MNDPMLLDAAVPTPTESIAEFLFDNPLVLVIAGIVLVAVIALVIAIIKNAGKK